MCERPGFFLRMKAAIPFTPGIPRDQLLRSHSSMKFTALLSAAGLLAFASQSQAVTVYSAALLAADGSPQDALITDASGNLLVSGFAGTGTFSIPDSQVQALVAQGTSASFAELASLFTPFGTDDFVNGTHTYFGTTQWVPT